MAAFIKRLSLKFGEKVADTRHCNVAVQCAQHLWTTRHEINVFRAGFVDLSVVIVEWLVILSVVLLVGCFGFDVILVFCLVSTYMKERMTNFPQTGKALLRIIILKAHVSENWALLVYYATS